MQKQYSKSNTEERTGPTLRSSRHKQELNEVTEQVETVPNKDKEQICTDFFSVAGTVLAAGVYTVAAQFINTHLFYLQTIHIPIPDKQSVRTSQIIDKIIDKILKEKAK